MRKEFRIISAAIVGLSSLAVAPLLLAQDSHPGRAVYEQNCAFCHDGGDARAHELEALQSMTADTLRFALTDGMMAAQGAMLSDADKNAVIEYLALDESGPDAWISSNMCAADRRRVDLSQTVSMGMVGVDHKSTRYITEEAGGLTTADMENLELAWAFGFPDVSGMRAAPVIAGDTLFYSATSTSKLVALDVETGCVKWAYDSPTALRSSVSIGELGDTGITALVFGDARSQVHAINAETGETIWVADGRAEPGVGQITGAVVLYEDKIIVPISASGVGAGMNPRHECCTGRGAVAALDAATGEKLWSYFTMEESDYTGEVSSAGVRLRGPSGAPIWTTPTVDAARGYVYVTTGENTSLPATDTSDAIIALDLETGEQQWVFQGTPNDVWNMACSTSGGTHGPNCPSAEESIQRDWDFGGAAILVDTNDGRELLLAGQKSGHLWAVNPDNGELVWSQRAGDGSPLGGNHWGIAVDDERVFMPINDPYFPGIEDYTPVPGMYAYDIATGEPLWQHRVSADCSGDRSEYAPLCIEKYGLSATPLVVGGAVISAAIDGRVYIFDAEDGRVLFEYDTAQPFHTVNGVEARGGAIDSHSIAAGSGMVFIGSGYGSFRQPPGNVLLAFRPKSSD